MKPKQRSKNQKQQPKNKLLALFVKTGAGLSAGVVLVTGTIYIAQLQEQDRRVFNIAKQFKCICPMNCNLTWGSCHCKEPGGATEAKTLIRSSLKNGLSDQEVISLLNKKYPVNQIIAT